MAGVQKKKNFPLWLSSFFCFGEVWSVHNTDAQCILEGKEEDQRSGEKMFMFNFVLP